MRRELSMLIAALVLLGCTTADNDGQQTTSTPTAGVTASTTSTQAPTTATPVNAERLTPGAGTAVAVSGTQLPREVVTGMTSHGGEMVSTDVWDVRFDTYGLPRIAGPQVVLVAAAIDVTRQGEGWGRSDGLQWMFMDTRHDGLEGLFIDVETAADLHGWLSTTETFTVDGASCFERRYTRGADPTNWLLQGCMYPGWPGMFAFGVTRTGVFDAPPPVVDPTVQAVADATGGEVTAVSVVFDHPSAEGSVVTLTTKATVSFGFSAIEATSTLSAGPLKGWAQSAGDASVMFVGGLGTSWVVADGTATLTGQGRVGL